MELIEVKSLGFRAQKFVRNIEMTSFIDLSKFKTIQYFLPIVLKN